MMTDHLYTLLSRAAAAADWTGVAFSVDRAAAAWRRRRHVETSGVTRRRFLPASVKAGCMAATDAFLSCFPLGTVYTNKTR